MKSLITLACVSLIVVGLGADRAHAFGCLGCCKYNYKCCAAQYNAFSPFCCNTVMAKKCLGLKKCFHQLDCGQPCCPSPCFPMDCASSCTTAPAAVPQGAAQPQQSFQAPVPSPMPVGLNPGMMGYPYPMPYGMPQAMPHGMPQAMVQPTGYPNPYYPNYGYPQAPAMMPGQAAMMSNGIVPLQNVPMYWNASMPTGR